MRYLADNGKDSYTQRNNKLDPFNACNVTSMVMALDYAGYVFPKGEYEQPEDNLMDFICTDPYIQGVYKDFIGKHAWAADYEAFELHDILSEAANMWIGERVTEFTQKMTLSMMETMLKNGRPLVVSGRFPYLDEPSRAPLHHCVCLIGYDDATNEFCINDPYGLTFFWTPTNSGKHVWLPRSQMMRYLKACDAEHKWAHFFKKAV